jgi:Tol biopolymer transport system component
VARLAFLGLIALSALCTVPTAAWATFPGRNGPIALVHGEAYKNISFTSALARINPRTGAQRQLPLCQYGNSLDPTFGDCFSLDNPAISPDGRELVFSTLERIVKADGSIDAQVGLRVMRLDGALVRRVPLPEQEEPLSPLSHYVKPRWSPDGSHFLISRLDARNAYEMRPKGILRVSSDGSQIDVIEPQGSEADWSSRGDIAFIRDLNLYVRSANGAIRRLTWHGATKPSWSPNGRRIAFQRGCEQTLRLPQNRRCGIYVIPSDGGKARLLVRRATEPTWSPDGTKIAFLRIRPSTADLPFSDARLLIIDLRSHRIRRPPHNRLIENDYTFASSPEWLPQP